MLFPLRNFVELFPDSLESTEWPFKLGVRLREIEWGAYSNDDYDRKAGV